MVELVFLVVVVVRRGFGRCVRLGAGRVHVRREIANGRIRVAQWRQGLAWLRRVGLK